MVTQPISPATVAVIRLEPADTPEAEALYPSPLILVTPGLDDDQPTLSPSTEFPAWS